MTNNKKPAINLDLLWSGARRVFDALSEQAKSEYLGFGKGTRRHFDVPEYIALKEEAYFSRGNSFIVLGLDRPSNILSGYGGTKDTHCAAIDIVAGRLGYRGRQRDNKGNINNVDPNFKLDAARIYISQKANVDSYFGLAVGNVGNTSNDSPRSTVALKADTVRIIARENIKLITRTDKLNSQGGKLTNASTRGYGIDLIAVNDTADLQPLTKGMNLQKCLTELIDAIHDLREIFKNFLQYNRTLTQALMNHTHRSPFYGTPTSADFENLLPKGAETLINNLTNVEVPLMLHMQKMSGIKQNYLDTPGGAEAVDDCGLFILSKYNSAN